ncbi:hypothetical protein QUF73_13325 [Cytobacillus sp. NJ13]|nr:hypothetical protein [Cytobacillus sp. NJ13]
MRINLGVIGPGDSVELVKKAAREFDNIEIFLFPYQRTEDTIRIINDNRHKIDQWFFSGQAPYHLALSQGLIAVEDGIFPPLNGNSLYKTLLEAQVKEQKILKKISLDTIKENEIHAIQNSIYPLEINTFPYAGYMPAQDIINYHLNLYQAGKIDAVITCLRAVYTRLTELKVPCYRVTPDIISISLMLQILKERGASNWYRKAQTAILGVEVFQVSSDEQLYSFKMKHQELELKRLLLNYAELINGSLVQIGDGHFHIYTTRGEMDLHLNDRSLFRLIEDVKLHSKLQIRTGLGYGITALEAEQNLRIAIQYARDKETPVIILVDESKQVTEKAAVNESFSYSGRSLGKEWEKKLKDSQISPAVISKIQSLSQHYRKSIVTSQELSLWLKSTERNARRILAEMERLQLVQLAGEEQSGQRGRPKKIYKLNIDQSPSI